MNTKATILQRQIQWAAGSGYQPDARGYLPEVRDNLLQPLSSSTRAAFDQGSGSELLDTLSRPAKMKALHSSSALAVNVFDYWCTRNRKALQQAMNLSQPVDAIRFEAQYPTGLGGNPPNLDVVLDLHDGTVAALESKFTEWLTPKPASKAPFKDKYFAADEGLWSRLGLDRMQVLAEAMHTGQQRYRYLDAPQLLKHALGLASQLGEGFSLLYIYYDFPCPEAEVHAEEIRHFASSIDARLRFRAIRYQDLFQRLHACELEEPAYHDYLAARYFAPID